MRPNFSGVICAVLVSWLQPLNLIGQERVVRPPAIPDSVSVVPGARYAKGGFVRFFAGSGHRDLWTVPLKVEVVDLATFAGGLTPLRLGGGMTTRTLHVQGNNGKRYVCRSVDKYAGQGLAEELRGTIYEAILQDQISSFHPSGALALPPLLKSVDVLHVEPVLRVLPDDARLAEFGELLSGELVLIEERPDEGPDDTPGFAGSRRIVNTSDFLDELEDDPRNRLDSRGYLTARLIDLLVGDRDKSVNNWWWARFDRNGGSEWRPIPRDRDQAFIQLDGAAKAPLRLYEPRLVRFSQDVPNVVGVTRSAWDIDRPFLVDLEKPTWDSVVTAVQQRLTDSVILAAVERMPPEHVELYGERMAEQLRTRRDRLHEAADRLYRIVVQYADVHATDVSERAVLDWTDDDHVSITIHTLSRDGEHGEGSVYWARTFDRRETREVRLYLHGGDDRVVLRGSGTNNMKLRIVGGGGSDELVDSSAVGGRNIYFYDAGDQTRMDPGSGVALVRRDAPHPRSWGETGPLSPDWGARWLPRPAFPYTSDLGILIYAGATRTGYGFLEQPYGNFLKLGAGYAPRETKFVADLGYEVPDLFSGVGGAFTLGYSGIETLKFYGFGNDTEATEPRSFYKVRRGRLLVEPKVTASLGSVKLDLGVRFEASQTDTLPDEPSLISLTRPYGVGTFLQTGATAAVTLDTRDRAAAATRGVFLQGGARVYPAVLDADSGAFGSVYGRALTFLSFSESGGQTLALGVRGEKVWGVFPYYEAAFLGGANRLRGFPQERFAGDASVYGSAEFRLLLGHLGLLVPWEFGLFVFTDAGRVFVSGESPGGWHASFGGGIWGAPLYRRFTGSITIARSVEGTAFYFGSGFGF
ncbi:MAG: BamA/TamA family outer membrane protein [Gemmatimonadota bacterium]|nr:MAG: BamA/TamA family outer membrane protein [Gemmatimonadota bacterium]